MFGLDCMGVGSSKTLLLPSTCVLSSIISSILAWWTGVNTCIWLFLFVTCECILNISLFSFSSCGTSLWVCHILYVYILPLSTLDLTFRYLSYEYHIPSMSICLFSSFSSSLLISRFLWALSLGVTHPDMRSSDISIWLFLCFIYMLVGYKTAHFYILVVVLGGLHSITGPAAGSDVS